MRRQPLRRCERPRKRHRVVGHRPKHSGGEAADRAVHGRDLRPGVRGAPNARPACRFVDAVLRLGRSGGCSGGRDVPPSWAHVALNLTGAASGAVAAMVGVPPLPSTVAALGWLVAPAAIGLAAAGWLAMVIATDLPAALGAWT